jgi:Family of unknown function (DUF6194)
VTESEIIELVAAMTGVVAVTASEANGAPQAAWGNTFFFYEPPGVESEERRLPFATLVQNDYGGRDALSELGRPGVFRLNIGVALIREAPEQACDRRCRSADELLVSTGS